MCQKHLHSLSQEILLPRQLWSLARPSAGGTVTSPRRSWERPWVAQSASGECVPAYKPAPHLASFCMILLLLGTQQLGQPEVCDLHVLRRLYQHVPGRQVPVHQAPVFQVIHALKHRATREGWASRGSVQCHATAPDLKSTRGRTALRRRSDLELATLVPSIRSKDEEAKRQR